jgi:hypothetical protein
MAISAGAETQHPGRPLVPSNPTKEIRQRIGGTEALGRQRTPIEA